ncbi:hypothetical protein GEZ89_08645 [Streptococcus mitis]|uniref:Uncharacterized protein n=1 Tax=Streptococcus mitis TaxID=28037 RepID=A0A7X1RP73_STRMT|nr:hypothetical protein [Streptococcus mitis]MQQ53005.1 hypothetical protein [Streptococcus mitis]
MRIGEMVDQLENQGLKIDIFAYDGKPTISVFYLDHKKRGNKFIEIYGKKDNSIDFLYENMEVAKQDYYKKYDVSIVKFHKETISPTSLLEFIEKTSDDGPITKQIKIENCSDEDSIEVAVSSYNVVKELCQVRKK